MQKYTYFRENLNRKEKKKKREREEEYRKITKLVNLEKKGVSVYAVLYIDFSKLRVLEYRVWCLISKLIIFRNILFLFMVNKFNKLYSFLY